MYYGSSDRLDAVLESMFSEYYNNNSTNSDLTLMAALESFDSIAMEPLGRYSYASEGVGGSIRNGIKTIVRAIKSFFQKLGEKIKKWWQGLFDKHKAKQNKITDTIKALKEDREHGPKLDAALNYVIGKDLEFNKQALDVLITGIKTEVDSIKESIASIKTCLTSLSESGTGTVPEKSTTTGNIERSISKINELSSELENKKVKFLDEIRKELSENHKDIKESEIGAILTITSDRVEGIEGIHKVVSEIEDIIEDNKRMADKIDSSLSKPDDDAESAEKEKYERLKKGVDLWKDVARYYSDFCTTTFAACNKVTTGFTRSGGFGTQTSLDGKKTRNARFS